MQIVSNAVRRALKERTYRPFSSEEVYLEQNKRTQKWEIILFRKGRKKTLVKEIEGVQVAREVVSNVTF